MTLDLTSALSKEDVLKEIEAVMNVQFSDVQKEAIMHHGTPLNLLSCAGSGKSTTLVGKLLLMERYYGISPAKTLAITFNKDAINDLEGRYKANRSKFKNNKERVTFKTYHALFYLILNSKFSKYSFLEIGEYHKYSGEISKYIQQNVKNYDDETLENIMSLRSLQINNLLTIDQLKNTKEFTVSNIYIEDFQKVVSYYERLKTADGRIDFDDLQMKMLQELQTNPSLVEMIHNVWDYILIDEFQDICKIQVEILKIMCKDHNKLTAIGDDDQSIYEFRGSKTEFIVDFDIYFPNAHRIIMDTNYRVPSNILLPVTASIEKNKKRVPKQMKAFKEGGELEFITVAGADESALHVAQVINDLVKEKEVSPTDIAILIRNNSQQRMVLDALTELNIPANCNKNYRLHSHIVLKDLEDIVKCAIDETDAKAFLKCSRRLLSYVRTVELQSVAEKMVSEGKSWRHYMLSSTNESVHAMSSLLFSVKAMVDEDKPFAEIIERIQPSYREYLKYMVNKGFNKNEIGDILKYVKAQSADVTFKSYYSNLKRKDGLQLFFTANGDEAVTISTMHRMKGLEYKYVFLLDITEENCPNETHLNKLEQKFNPSVVEDYIEQERRLFYVAWTRAKEHLYVIVNKKIPSRFILESIEGLEKIKSTN